MSSLPSFPDAELNTMDESDGTNGKIHDVSEDTQSVPADLPESTASVYNLIEFPDPNYWAEVAALPVNLVAIPSGSDPVLFRKWLKEDGAKLSRMPQCTRFRTEVEVPYTDVAVSYDGGQYEIRVHDPVTGRGEKDGPRSALMFYHGGGWIHGDAAGDQDVATFFASELRAVVFNVSYRLAPEDPFPASLNDCYHALGWAIEYAKKYNIDTNRIAIWGCSSGGNLAASVALRDVMEHNPSRIRHVNLLVPVTCHPKFFPAPLDQKMSSLTDDLHKMVQEYIKLWDLYTYTPSDPLASPLLATPPAHHPSTHTTVAGCDLLRDEGIAYALQLRKHGIDSSLEIVPGVPHGMTLAPAAVVAKQFFRDQVRILNSALNVSWLQEEASRPKLVL